MDGLSVCVEGRFAAGEGADEHQEGGSRQMEVGDESVDDAELVSWVDEDVCPSGRGFKGVCALGRVVLASLGGVF